MSRDHPNLIDRIPGMVWFFAGMLMASLAVGLLLAIAHHQLGDDTPPPIGPTAQNTPDAPANGKTILMADTTMAEAPTAASAADIVVTAMATTTAHPPSTPAGKVAIAPKVPTPSPKDVASRAKRGIRSTLKAWSMAWSDKNMTTYLAQYHTEFTPDDGIDRAHWARQRHQRIAGKPGRITVFLRNIDIRFDGGTAMATFIQDYDSGNYHDSTRKRLTLARAGERWQILREQSLD